MFLMEQSGDGLIGMGSVFAKRIKSRAQNPSPRWHLDEVYTKINGKMIYLWRAVDDEGTVLDIVVQSRRNKKASMRLLRKLIRNSGVKPKRIATDRLASYRAALKDLNLQHVHDVGGRKNNRAENSHLPIRRRERKSRIITTRDPRLSLIRQTNIFHLKADIFKGVRQGGLVG